MLAVTLNLAFMANAGVWGAFIKNCCVPLVIDSSVLQSKLVIQDLARKPQLYTPCHGQHIALADCVVEALNG